MTRPDCAAIGELDAAFALGAVEPREARAITEHLAACDEPHAELRHALSAGTVLSAALPPMQPRPQLRERLMTSIAAMPQEHRAPRATPRGVEPARREVRGEAPAHRGGWLDWLSPGWARGLAAASLVGLVVLAGWNVALQGEISAQQRAMTAVADAISQGAAAYRVEGEAGSGWLVADEEHATFIGADLPDPGDGILELWLIDAAGTPVPVGTVEPADELAVARLERPISGFTTFAITVEEEYVEAPTGTPIMVGTLS